MVQPGHRTADSGAAPGIFAELLALLHPGGGLGCALHRGAAQRNPGPGYPPDVYVRWHYGDGLSQA